MTDTPEQLTIIMKDQLAHAFVGEAVNVFVAPYAIGNSLVIQVQSPLPQLKAEHTMFGKAIRLFKYLEERCYLSVLLRDYQLKKVVLTEALRPGEANDYNTIIFETPFLLETFQQWTVLRLAGDQVLEAGIRTLIAENTHL